MTTKLGELLKSEREKRGLSLHEIGMSLKINPKILTAIEEGDQANFPAKTFLRGFVKSYAQYLRLDVNQVMQMFFDEYGGIKIEEVPLTPGNPQAPTQPQTQAPAGPPKYETSLKRPDDSALPVSSNNRIYTILVAILLLTLIAFVAKMMDKYQKESTVERDETDVTATTTTTTSTTIPVAGEGLVTPVDGGTTTTTLTGAVTTTTLAGAAGGAVTTTTLKAPAVGVVNTTTTTTLKPVVTTTTLRPVATTTTTLRPAAVTTTTLRPAVVTTTTLPRPTVTTTTLARTATPTAATATTATTTTTTSSGLTGTAVTTTTLKAASTEIIIEALNRVSIRFSLNAGQKWETLELNPDQVHTFRSRSGILIEVSDGGAVNVIVNGRDRGVPGTIGRPLKLNFP